MQKPFKFELGDVVNHKTEEYGDRFLIVGRYAFESIEGSQITNMYRVRSQHSHLVDMCEAELQHSATPQRMRAEVAGALIREKLEEKFAKK